MGGWVGECIYLPSDVQLREHGIQLGGVLVTSSGNHLDPAIGVDVSEASLTPNLLHLFLFILLNQSIQIGL